MGVRAVAARGCRPSSLTSALSGSSPSVGAYVCEPLPAVDGLPRRATRSHPPDCRCRSISCREIVALEDLMQQNSKPVLADVFPFADALTAQARLRLAALLAVPGRPPAILPGELASFPLPVDRDVRSAVRDAIEGGFGWPTQAELAPCRLDAVIPALARCDPAALARSAPSQLCVPLAQHLMGTPLAEFTIGQIDGWSGFDPRRVAQLVGFAVGAALDVIGPRQPVPSVANPTMDDLSTVLAHDAAMGGELRRLLENLCSAGPLDVGGAAGRVLAAVAAGPDRRLAFFDEALAACGDERDRGVFENAVLPLGPPVTRPELAVALGIGVDRVRRLAARAAQRVGSALDHAPSAVRQLTTTVSERLGAAVPRTAVHEALASLGLPALPDSRSRLLLWMAGPYRPVDGHPGWVAVEPAGLVAETRRLIHEDGGVRPVEHVVNELGMLGIAAAHAEGWLARQPVRVCHGLVVATTGAPGDVVERALHAQGRAMAVDEMAGWVPDGRSGIEKLWTASDRRFVTDGDALALTEWGGAPSQAFSVAAEELIAHYPDGRGARVSLVPSPRPEMAAT